LNNADVHGVQTNTIMGGMYIMDMNQIVEGVILSKSCSIKPSKDSEESKKVTLNIKFDGVTLGAVFQKSVSAAVIQWQNGPGRSKFDQWENNGKVDIEFKTPGATAQVDPVTAIINAAKASDMTVEDYLKYELKKRN